MNLTDDEKVEVARRCPGVTVEPPGHWVDPTMPFIIKVPADRTAGMRALYHEEEPGSYWEAVKEWIEGMTGVPTCRFHLIKAIDGERLNEAHYISSARPYDWMTITVVLKEW